MTDSSRPIHAAVPVLGSILIGCTVVLLVLGGLTTSGRAGMADPVWPTEPWYLIENSHVFREPRIGFLLEHTHRAAGWIVGGLAVLLALTAWIVGPNLRSRLAPMIAITAFVASYGYLHGQMMVAQRTLNETGVMAWPKTAIYATLGGFLAVVFTTGLHLLSRQRGSAVRGLVTLVLTGVMIQGLLGGLRVLLDKQLGLKDSLGVELSQWHGLFAQFVFCLILLTPWVARRRTPEDALNSSDHSRLGWLGLVLVGTVFVQLLWAVWLRHNPTVLAQRLHFLTAFAVMGLIVFLTVRILTGTSSKKLLGGAAYHLLAIVGVQIALGVEAWLGKFAAAGPEASLAPMERTITTYVVVLRTLHQFIGACLLGSIAVLAYRIWRKPAKSDVTNSQPDAADVREVISIGRFA